VSDICKQLNPGWYTYMCF